MKKIILIVALLMIVPACELESYLLQEGHIKIGNIHDYDFEGSEEIPEFKNEIEVQRYVNKNSVYITDKELFNKNEYIQTPEEFFYNRNMENKMQGDCDCHALFLAYLIHTKLNIENVKLLVISGMKNEHVIVQTDNYYLDSVSQIRFKKEEIKNRILMKILYSEMLWMAINYHDFVGKYH